MDNSVGTVDTFPTRYMDLNGKEGDFYSKVYAIGKVNLDPNYINLIMKTFSSETSFYEIYSFTKTGKCLSVICLFLYYNKRLRLDEIDFVRISSKILADKTIHWIEKGHGVEILRVYRLRPDGYFEITQENQKGEFEY